MRATLYWARAVTIDRPQNLPLRFGNNDAWLRLVSLLLSSRAARLCCVFGNKQGNIIVRAAVRSVTVRLYVTPRLAGLKVWIDPLLFLFELLPKQVLFRCLLLIDGLLRVGVNAGRDRSLQTGRRFAEKSLVQPKTGIS